MWCSKNGCTRYTIKNSLSPTIVSMDFSGHQYHRRKWALHAGQLPTVIPADTALAVLAQSVLSLIEDFSLNCITTVMFVCVQLEETFLSCSSLHSNRGGGSVDLVSYPLLRGMLGKIESKDDCVAVPALSSVKIPLNWGYVFIYNSLQ